MIGKTNAGQVQGILNVTCDNSCTVTVTQTGKPYSFTQSGTSMSFKLPNSGTWHISATFGGLTQTKDVTLTPGQALNVKVLDSFYLYNAGQYMTGFTSGWSAGEQSTYVQVSSYGASTSTSTSTGKVNLRGYKTIRAKITGWISSELYAVSEIRLEIIDTNGNVLAVRSERLGGASKTYDLTWTFNVTSINNDVKFRIASQGWSGGGDQSGTRGTINLHSIQLSTT